MSPNGMGYFARLTGCPVVKIKAGSSGFYSFEVAISLPMDPPSLRKSS